MLDTGVAAASSATAADTALASQWRKRCVHACVRVMGWGGDDACMRVMGRW